MDTLTLLEHMRYTTDRVKRLTEYLFVRFDAEPERLDSIAMRLRDECNIALISEYLTTVDNILGFISATAPEDKANPSKYAHLDEKVRNNVLNKTKLELSEKLSLFMAIEESLSADSIALFKIDSNLRSLRSLIDQAIWSSWESYGDLSNMIESLKEDYDTTYGDKISAIPEIKMIDEIRKLVGQELDALIKKQSYSLEEITKRLRPFNENKEIEEKYFSSADNSDSIKIYYYDITGKLKMLTNELEVSFLVNG